MPEYLIEDYEAYPRYTMERKTVVNDPENKIIGYVFPLWFEWLYNLSVWLDDVVQNRLHMADYNRKTSIPRTNEDWPPVTPGAPTTVLDFLAKRDRNA